MSKIVEMVSGNQLKYEELGDVSGSIFANVYRGAGEALGRIIDRNQERIGEERKDDQGVNVISFLGEKGRGKTSVLLSFLTFLEQMEQGTSGSSWCPESVQKSRFYILPYIDAAMLANNEFLIDVILAQMWDKFENHIKTRGNGSLNPRGGYFEQLVKDGFVKVRKAYLLLKEKEDRRVPEKRNNLPTASELHELAASVNLRDEFRELVKDYLGFFSYQEKREERNTYLVIAVDDLDMGVERAYHVMEQIRRFLRIPQVVIFVTADMERLRRDCEFRYKDIFLVEREREQFIHDYLEKGLPYNMRLYMPELREDYNGKLYDKLSGKQFRLTLKSEKEKEMILEFMANNGVFFDGVRRKRHFLQNDSMRSMVNYFERLSQIKGGADGLKDFLKIDLQERMQERISDNRQKAFIRNLCAGAYEDANNLVIGYAMENLKGKSRIAVTEPCFGQALYACGLLRDEDAGNLEFVNCILMLYTIIFMTVQDSELRKEIIGNSVFGEWEYSALAREGRKTSQIQGFDSRAGLEIVASENVIKCIENQDVARIFLRIVSENEEGILAWLYSLLFVVPELPVGTLQMFQSDSKEEKDQQTDKTMKVTFVIRPQISAYKSYFGSFFRTRKEIKNVLRQFLDGALAALQEEVSEKLQKIRKDDLDSKTRGGESQNEEEALKERLLNTVLGEEPKSQPVEEEYCLKNVEMLYSIGKKLGKMPAARGNTGKDLLNMLCTAYQVLEDELGKRDQYYKEQVKTVTCFREAFKNQPQSCFLQEWRKKSFCDEMASALEQRFGSLFAQVSGSNQESKVDLVKADT